MIAQAQEKETRGGWGGRGAGGGRREEVYGDVEREREVWGEKQGEREWQKRNLRKSERARERRGVCTESKRQHENFQEMVIDAKSGRI